ncbi:MAG: 16S rRNA (cytidine(1402)-2'-O)-methyltransferase [Patescibacteria group bacterium]
MGTLYVVATPIGNLEDISIRAIKTLLSVPVIACEDTRHTGNLLKILSDRYTHVILNEVKNPDEPGSFGAPQDDKKRRYISVRDWNEVEIVPKVLEALNENDVALVSDAGTPLLSDPGFKVVRAAKEAGFVVSPIPGPFAAAAALSAAGLPTNKFVFHGFLNKKWELTPEMTNIIYESPERAQMTLEEIKTRYPEAKIMVAQELTKVHESITEYAEGMKIKGEVTILVYLG